MTSVCVKAGETEGYLYLIGVEPSSEVILNENVVLEPVECRPDPDAMIDSVMKYGSKSEINLGIVIATLRLTRAQFHIKTSSADGRSLAVNTRNAQTDICLLSALLHKEIYWNLQCNVSADQFNQSSFMNVIMSHQLFLPRSIEVIERDECKLIESVFVSASEMMDKPAFATAVNALWSYRQSLRPSVQLAILWAGIEALFRVQAELRFRISLLTSKFLDGDADEYIAIRKLYDDRSKAVHEGIVKSKVAVESTAALLHKLILKCIEINDLPNEKDLLFS